MSTRTDAAPPNIVQSACWGVLRGLVVETALYPLEVVKIQQQCSPTTSTMVQISKRILQEGGCQAFYRGLYPQLIKTAIRQGWGWPMMTGIPRFLHSYQLGDALPQVITGMSIATIDAVMTAPLERLKILLAAEKKRPISLASIYQNGWQGFTSYWAKRSVSIVTFLTTQEYLRNRSRAELGSLDSIELTKIGFQVSLIVSVVAAPFDMMNTRKQVQNPTLYRPPSLKDFSFTRVASLYRSWPLYAFSLVVNNVVTISLFEKLRHSK